jgi:lipoprotein-releasing system ATP-binding protein
MLELHNVSKEYPAPGGPLKILADLDLSFRPGDSASIVGPSGSGKSTLLYIIGALEPPTRGTVLLSGRNPYEMDENCLAQFRNEKIGFIFQDHHLLPQCTVLENVLIPTLVASKDVSKQDRALNLLEQVGLGSRIHHRPYELSGGEKQRVALARALIMEPQLLLCDEPTGNLDRASSDIIISLLLDLHKKQHGILIMVTHNPDVAVQFAFRYLLADTSLQKLS